MTVLRRQHTIPTDGLVGEWLLDWNWLDSSGNNNNLTNTNVGFYDTERWYAKKCAVFATNAKSQGVHTLWTGNISFDYFIQVFVSGTQSRWEILALWNPVVLNQGIFFSIRSKSGGNDAVYFDYSNSAWDSTASRVIYNSWNFIRITKSGDTLTIRINNNTPEVFTKTGLNVTTNTFIIWDYGAWLAFFSGKAWLARLYSTILSENDVNSIICENNRLLWFSQGNVPPDSEPQFQWKLDGNSTASIGGNNGTDTSISYIDSEIGKMANFPALGSKIVVTETTSMALTNFTLSAFFSVTNTSNFQALISRRSSFYQGYMVYVSGGNINFLVGDGTDNFISIAISPNTRYHIVATYDNTAKQMKLYLNAGTPVSKTNTNGIVNSGQLNFWYDPPNGTWYGLIGTLDHINFDTSVASVSRITQLYFEGTKFSGKYLPEDFSEGLEFLYTGKNLTNTLYDQSGKWVNGTASNVTFWSANQKWLVPMTFNGSSSKIEMGATMRLTGSFTVNGLIKTTVTGSYKQIVQSYSQLSPSVSGYRVFVNNTNTISFVIGKNTGYTDGTDYKSLTGTINVCDGKLHLVSCVYDGATMKIYIDGTLDVSVAWTFWPAYQTDCKGSIGTNNYQQALYTDWYSGDIIFVSGHLKAYTKNHIKRLFTSLFFT